MPNSQSQIPLPFLLPALVVLVMLCGTQAAAQPNLTITAVSTVDSSGAPMSPKAGEGFYLRADFTITNPTCDDYQLSRIVNGFQSVQPEINWGCGYSGTTYWYQFWGHWILHDPGTYPLTVILDVNDTVAETNEADNEMTINLTITEDAAPEWDFIGLDLGRKLLGDGTDVIVGTMDDAFDYLHPYFTGNDSEGRPRLVASLQNSLGTGGSPINANHATRILGPLLARAPNPGAMTGMVPDARYVTAEFLRRDTSTTHPMANVLDAAGFLVENGVDVINMSWSLWLNATQADAEAGEAELTNLLVDYLAYGENIVAVPAVNQLESADRPTAPGSSRNTITVGGMEGDLARAWSEQDHGPTLDGRSKPDLLGNDAEGLPGTWPYWRDGYPETRYNNGTSATAPFVTGGVAQLLDYGMAHGESTDHKVIKAVLMSSAVKALDFAGDPWTQVGDEPLDNEQGAGVLNMVRAHAVYSGGMATNSILEAPGYALDTVESAVRGSGGQATYDLGSSSEEGEFSATLVWDRHTLWNDVNGSGKIDDGDSFALDPNDVQDDLDLVLVGDAGVFAVSRSTVDNVEHIWVENLPPGAYQLVVERQDVANSGTGEEFALAVYSSATWTVPIFRDGFESGDTTAWQ